MGDIIGEIAIGLLKAVILSIGAFWVALFLKIVLQKPENFSTLYNIALQQYFVSASVSALLFLGISTGLSIYYFY